MIAVLRTYPQPAPCMRVVAADESTEHYESVVLWYGSPTRSLVLTDSFTMDSPGHQYTASNPVRYNVTSRYEKGVDHVGNTMVFPPETLSASVHSGQSSFELQIAPANKGVLLRRTLDLAFANQRARVHVRSCATTNEWTDAGVWFTAGSNTVVFSDPHNETGAPNSAEVVQTSNRRFRQEECLLAAGLTVGCSTMGVPPSLNESLYLAIHHTVI